MASGLEALALVPGFVASCASPASVRSWWKEVHPEVYAAEVLEPSWCEALDSLVVRHEESSLRGDAPSNTMHTRGLLISALGLEAALESLVSDWLAPVAELLFSVHLEGAICEEHSYIVRYGEGYDADLAFHVDDSEVTFNLCLSHDGSGSRLLFEGARCALHVDSAGREEERFAWRHRPGVALLHAGKNRHRVDLITQGVRRNLITWMRDGGGVERWQSNWANASCPPWCAHQES